MDKFFDKQFWIHEAALYYKRPYLRLEKCARLVNRIAKGDELDLLDVGCGPATLAQLLHKNIHYHGIDIAIHNPGPNLIEMDIINHPIGFENKKFDIVVATGLFEYMGQFQQKKMSEIQQVLKEKGKFIASYTNFSHIHSLTDYTPYNNIVSIKEFKHDLELFFHIERVFPTFYNWNGTEPRKRWSYTIQKYLTVNIPMINSRFAVSYFFICTPKINPI